MLSHVFGAVDKTSSSFSAHGKIGNFIIIIISDGDGTSKVKNTKNELKQKTDDHRNSDMIQQHLLAVINQGQSGKTWPDWLRSFYRIQDI